MDDVIGQPLPARPGLRLTETQRRAMSTRLMLQAPQGLSVAAIARIRADLDSRVRGLAPDVFMTLDAMRLLADQGNEVAKIIFEHESKRLGLTRTFFSRAK